MESKREQAVVGLFVVIATTVLITTMFAIGGAFGHSGATYLAYFKNAGGLEPGAIVRYSGVKVGRVERMRIDDKDPTRIEMKFSVAPNTPVKADSIAKIASLSALGENFLEIVPGSVDKSVAPSGTVLPSKEFFGITQVADMLSDLTPTAKELLQHFNERAVELEETLDRVNDLLNDKNRANLSATIGNINGMLEEDRPRVHSALGHVDATTAKLPALIDDFKKTVAKVDDALGKMNSVLGDNKDDLHKAILDLRKMLADASSLLEQVSRTTSSNADNLDETLENIRITTENLKQFTDTIKTRPSTLIRSTAPPDHTPGKPAKP